MIYLLVCLCLCLCLCFILINFVSKLWWTPIRIQSYMRSQGIKGPSYRFMQGNNEEIIEMKKSFTINPMELPHNTFPRVQPHIYSWFKIYGTNFLFWYGTRPQLVVTDPELIKVVLNSKEEEYKKVGSQELLKRLFGEGLVFSTGKKWSKVRKLANHAFHAESLKGMVPAMITSVEVMLQRWRQHDGMELDVYEEFKVLASEVISRTAFGSSYLEGEKIFDMLKRMTLIAARNNFRLQIPSILKLVKANDDKEVEELRRGIREAIINIIAKRENKETDNYGTDFLGLLMEAYNDPDKSKRISIDELIDECKNFYGAGYETTSNSITWTILLLAMHKDWQDKARNEVLEIFGKQKPTANGITKLKIINMIINESLRLYPPVFKIVRQVQKEVRLGSIILPDKMEIFVSILAVHQNVEIWGKDANIFNPERFERGVAKATNNNISAFLPFGMGPRTCVGFNFAITELKIAITMILQNYRFTLSPNYIHSPIDVITMNPKHGLQIKIDAI